MSGGVGSCSRWWILGQSYTMCSAVSSPIPHSLLMVSTAHPILCSQYFSSWWWPLLRRPIIVCSFLDNFDSSLRSRFSPFMLYPANSFMGDSPSGSTPDGDLRRVIVALNILIGCSSFSGLVRLPSHSPLPCSGLDIR